MAGLAIRIDAQSDAIAEVFRDLENLDLSEPLDEIGVYLDTQVALRFDSESDPDGNRWPPSQRALKTGDKTLQDRGHLRDSITHNLLSPTELEHGSDAVYAAIHQLGGKAGRGGSVNITPRPFLGINADDETEIREIINTWLLGRIEAKR